MNINSQNIDKLRQTIESLADRKMQTPKDFDYLSEQIFEKVHQSVSPTTLKRMWGYLSETTVPRPSTLNILSQFAGYESWDSFCQAGDSEEPKEKTPTLHETESEEPTTQNGHRGTIKWIAAAIVAIIAIAALTWLNLHQPSQPPTSYILKQGDRFNTYMDYLKLFGINDSDKYWGRVLPHHPSIVIWGPEYHHPYWHNEGNKDSMMPTITERWEPADVDKKFVVMRNKDKYNHEVRLNEVRITFMKNLVDTSYVFVGVYRLSLQQSDTTRCVWERVAEECDLDHLDYLNELRN